MVIILRSEQNLCDNPEGAPLGITVDDHFLINIFTLKTDFRSKIILFDLLFNTLKKLFI